jgi:hypothetical protein
MHVLEQHVGGKKQIFRRPTWAVNGAIVADSQDHSPPSGQGRPPPYFFQDFDLAPAWRHVQRVPRICFPGKILYEIVLDRTIAI